MIQYKTFLNKPILLEYLTDAQKQKYSAVGMTKEARTSTDHFFGEGNDKVWEALNQSAHFEKSETHRRIEQHLNREIPVDQYRKGRLIDERSQERRIGPMIKHNQLRDEFSADQTRGGSKTGPDPHHISVVRGTEVAGQTNKVPTDLHPEGHSWHGASCKNIVDGFNNHYLQHEVKHGTVAVFGHDENGKEIYRAALQPYRNKEKQYVYGIDAEYGLKHPAFTAHAQDVANRLSGEPSGSNIYKIHPKVYNDSGIDKKMHPKSSEADVDEAIGSKHLGIRRMAATHSNLTSKQIFKLLDSKDYKARDLIVRHPKFGPEHVDHVIENPDDKYSNYLRSSALSHPTAVRPHHIEKLLTSTYDDQAEVRSAAVAHPVASSEQILRGLKDPEMEVRIGAIRNPNATVKHIDHVLEHEKISHNDDSHNGDYYSHGVIQAALRHKNITSTHLHWGLGIDKPQRVQYAALGNTKIKPEHLDKVLSGDHSTWTKEVAAKHPNVSKENLHTALSSVYDDIRASAIQNSSKNLDEDHITQALGDTNQYIRKLAIMHPKVNAEHIEKAMHDPSSTVRYNALKNPLVTSEQLSDAIKDESSNIRERAFQHPNIEEKHISKGIKDEEWDVRMEAALHPKANAKHISYVLKHDKEPYIKSSVILKAPNINETHLRSMLKHPHDAIRHAAKERIRFGRLKSAAEQKRDRQKYEPDHHITGIDKLRKEIKPKDAPKAPRSDGGGVYFLDDPDDPQDGHGPRD